tara:strand:+ start:506 stop:742 length:237 start_codon:yes stop_codon:yes gene_type:complete
MVICGLGVYRVDLRRGEVVLVEAEDRLDVLVVGLDENLDVGVVMGFCFRLGRVRAGDESHVRFMVVFFCLTNGGQPIE